MVLASRYKNKSMTHNDSKVTHICTIDKGQRGRWEEEAAKKHKEPPGMRYLFTVLPVVMVSWEYDMLKLVRYMASCILNHEIHGLLYVNYSSVNL